MARPIGPVGPRFWSKVEIKDFDGCWLWTASTSRNGYGQFGMPDGSKVLPHRLAWELCVGLIPLGMTLDHECHNADRECVGGWKCQHRRCVNPNHLRIKSYGDNSDASPNGRRARTHCPQGHPYDETNTYWHRGHRQCRICRAEHVARFKARHR